MKTAILITLLTASLCYAKQTPLITYDPNTVIDSPIDPNNVRVTIVVEITKEQYAAMQELGYTLYDAVSRSRLSSILDRWIDVAKKELTKTFTVTELKAKVEK